MIEHDYLAASREVALLDRPPRKLLHMTGRAPARMLTGMVTGRMPPDLRQLEDGVLQGWAPCSAMLTPKGRMVTELRLARLANGESGALLLDLPQVGVDGALAHLARYVPPRFARIAEPEEELALLTVAGPGAAALLSSEELGLRMEPSALETLKEGEERTVADGSHCGTRVIRGGEVLPPSFDVIASVGTIRSLRERFGELKVPRAGNEIWETLRLEKGRPAFGVEMDQETLPPEAGIQDRCFDHRKGCYTGQEVIVRIRDRGKVNRLLRGLLVGPLEPPAPSTPLFHPGREAPAGEIRSAVRSPRFGQTIALGYLRREVEPPATVRLGSADGPSIGVRALEEDGWALVEGDGLFYP